MKEHHKSELQNLWNEMIKPMKELETKKILKIKTSIKKIQEQKKVCK